MREFTEDEMAILDQITSAKDVWIALDQMQYEGTTMTQLVLAGIVELWPNGKGRLSVAGGPYATLTPLGAEMIGYAIVEYAETLPSHWTEPKMARSSHRPEPYPCSDPIQRWDRASPKTGFGLHEPRHVRMPGHRRGPSKLPGLLNDPGSSRGSEILRDEDGKPIEFFRGENPTGYTIVIDPRLDHSPYRRTLRSRRHYRVSVRSKSRPITPVSCSK